MKPFWRRQPKKKPKGKNKSQVPPIPRPRPEPWKPPHPPTPIIAPKVPAYEKPSKSRSAASTPKRNDHEKEFMSVFRQLLSEKSRPWDIWKDFIVMSACGLSNPVDKTHYEERENRYLNIINKYRKSQQRLFPELFGHMVMALEEDSEQDFLGKMFMDLNLGYGELKQIFTPYEVCKLMAQITMDDVATTVQKKGYITINDPCCGAGATLIASIHEAKYCLKKVGLNYQNHVLVSGQDIEEVVALMCYIQLSLLGVAGYVKVGNALTEPMTNNDSLENYWFTPMYFSNTWSYRRIFRRLDELTKDKAGETNGRG